MYETIVVPTDGGPGTDPALTRAIELAEAFDSDIHVVYAVDERFDGLGGSEDETMADRLRERGRDATERACKQVSRRDIDCVTAVREGRPDRAILDYVDEVDADVVVMATHGRSGVDRIVLGSVTERVSRRSTVPVLVVPRTDGEGSVDTPAEAVETAAKALATEGHPDAEPVEEPYRATNTWIVRFAEGDTRYNVHVDRATGSARIANVSER